MKKKKQGEELPHNVGRHLSLSVFQMPLNLIIYHRNKIMFLDAEEKNVPCSNYSGKHVPSVIALTVYIRV